MSLEELKTLTREDISDDYVLHFVTHTLNISTHQAIRSALIHFSGVAHDNHVELHASNQIAHGRLPKEWRKYYIDVLSGDAVLYTNEDGTEAALYI